NFILLFSEILLLIEFCFIVSLIFLIFSPSAEMPNPSENDFRQARKCQTLRKMTFAERGNAKPFGK
ncbi:hypothetical protein, partial [Segatella salivae]|uniref:hypothetical protein n=1 Tax=Segatella salivae TaxID=228604 RepID=UPI00248E883B